MCDPAVTSAPSVASQRRRWWVLVTLAVMVYALLARWPDWLRVIGVNHYGVWFLDLTAILASNDALSLGLDPYAHNPLDVFGRPHVYSYWWLQLGRFGLTGGDALWLGFVLAAVFFVAAITPLRPRQPGEVVWSLAILCSPPVLLALERANNDLVIFVLLAPVVPCLLATRPWMRLLAVPLIVSAAALKAYPAVAVLVLLAGAGPRDTRRLLFVAALLFLALLPDAAMDFSRYTQLVPKAEGLMTMGARNLFVGLGLPISVAGLTGLCCGAVVIVALLRSKFISGWAVPTELRGAWLAFSLGASLLAGCFFAGVSFSYRWVFALWLAPLLWRLPRDPAAPSAVRRLAVATAALLVFVLWADALFSSVLGKITTGLAPDRIMKLADRFFYLEQPVTWAFFVCLLAFLAHFVRDGLRRLFSADPVAPPPAR